jgi:hypothetical protein
MSTQYRCGSPKRRQAVLEHPSLNGIDFLEVLPGPTTLLLVHCMKKMDDLTGCKPRIEGGAQSLPVRVLWYGIASNPPKDSDLTSHQIPLTEEELDYLKGINDRDRTLILRTDSCGDFTLYRLMISCDAGWGFDPQLGELEFSFKIDQLGDHDCLAREVCLTERPVEPPIDYLAKDYSSFRKLILDRLSMVQPGWGERNPADIEVALAELLAYTGDYLSYYQDAVASEAYLNTARRRTSVRRHVRLLDYPMHEGCNARAWVCFELDAGGPLLLQRQDAASKRRTKLITRCSEQVIVDPSVLDEVISRDRPEIFEALNDTTLYPSHNCILFYTWDEAPCCLPKGSTRATLCDDPDKRLMLRPGDILIFEELIGPTGLAEDADASHKHPVRLTRVSPEAGISQGSPERYAKALYQDPLTGQPIIEIEWHSDDALTFPLCISAIVHGVLLSNMSCARGNVVLADHGSTIDDEPVVPPYVPEDGPYRPHLERSPLTFKESFRLDERLDAPASSALDQDPREAMPNVRLTGGTGGAAWTVMRDLLNSGRFSQEFAAEVEDDGMAYLRFGDDTLGEMPAPGTALRATYRIGNGSTGNVGAGAICHLSPADGSTDEMRRISRVWNPLPARGGTDAEPLRQVRLYAPVAFRRQERAVTEDDYADAAMRHPEVKKAVATLRWTGSWYTAFITVDRKARRPVDVDFKRELSQFLERFRLAGYDIEIDSPQFVPLDISLTICARPGYIKEHVKSALLERFSSSYLPDGRRGFFHPDSFTFGQPVYLSRIIAAAMEVPGVAWVDASDKIPNRFQRWGRPPMREIQEGVISLNRLEIALLDNDPGHPERGKMEFIMEGGL